MLFSDAGPDVRLGIGNEHGFAYETTWVQFDAGFRSMPACQNFSENGQLAKKMDALGAGGIGL